MGWTGGYVLLALLLAPYLRKFGKFTVPDFIGDRYYSNTARSVAVFCALIVSFTYIAGQMRGVGVVFSRYLEVDIVTGVLIGMGIVLFYAVLGGMKGITYTQVGAVLRFDLCLYGASDLHLISSHRQCDSTTRLWIEWCRWGIPFGQARRLT
jgi:Na+(H+)/acetate symporter ActP